MFVPLIVGILFPCTVVLSCVHGDNYRPCVRGPSRRCIPLRASRGICELVSHFGRVICWIFLRLLLSGNPEYDSFGIQRLLPEKVQQSMLVRSRALPLLRVFRHTGGVCGVHWLLGAQGRG